MVSMAEEQGFHFQDTMELMLAQKVSVDIQAEECVIVLQGFLKQREI